MKVGNSFIGSIAKFPSSEYYKIVLWPIRGNSDITLEYSNSFILIVSST